ncbi:mandelate racemase/muconate lactonizing protein [Natrialba hulunbeirensis JCM 10989]|uniref:Mandelate racemase/muconate lactonizing protein n=1 Tax=Natrialba hulunbeirensis JCM 10989 TaxID=1227493 RepID=M0A1A2_9EURY|nr:enolase C-terminal domain-like protein [Natrialba hulunbeirensis]ELY92096.1 mandelate racemase/muconate lactonizing protein [Natrialba hulunbeirensis JCM 10989]
MKITGYECVELTGTLEGYDDARTFYEERLAIPLDIYDEFRSIGAEYLMGTDDVMTPYVDEERDEIRVTQTFLRLTTDAGIEGVAGPIDREWARLVDSVAGLLVGRDALATEKLWDLMYRNEIHGRKGKTMKAISAIDCALWDLKGKYYDEPVYRLLGGPTRTEIPAYASMLGYSVDPADVRERATTMKAAGYDAQKWFFRHGPGSGADGLEQNLELAEAARNAVGDGYDLMFDCWMSWTRSYAERAIPKLADYDPRWIEEPVHPDRLDQLARLRETSPVPIAGGEHEYTRWGIHQLLQREALDVVQADTFWAGGITELQRICTLGSVHDVPVIPHGHSVSANLHLTAAQSPDVSPVLEYLVKWNEGFQFFLEEPPEPEDGVISLDDRPGLGIVIDESVVASRTQVCSFS